MSRSHANYTNTNKMKEGSCWNKTENKLQYSITKSRFIDTPTYEVKSSNSSNEVKEQSSSENMKGVTQQHSSKKKTKWCKLSEFSSNVWEDSIKGKIVGKNSRTVSQIQTSFTESVSNSHESRKIVSHDSGTEKNVNSTCSLSQSVECASQEMKNVIDTEKESDNNIPMDIEEKRRLRRERQKVKKEMKRQEKAILREEEMRKKRLAPKDQKLTIIDHSILDRFLVKDTTPSNEETKGTTYIGCEFPSLGEVLSAASRSTRHHKKNENIREKSKTRDVSSETQVSPRRGENKEVATSSDSVDQFANSRIPVAGIVNFSGHDKSLLSQFNVEEELRSEVSNKAMRVGEDKTTGKRPKRRDPIQLDIKEILKVQETKHEATVKQHTNKMTQKTETVRYSGNILDSDNPERKRGKQREVPKPKKPSNLKQIILQERVKRKEARLQHSSVQVDGSDVKEMNHSNDYEKLLNDDMIISGEYTSNTDDLQKDSVENLKEEMKVQSEKCNVNTLISEDKEIHHDSLPLQEGPNTEVNTDSMQFRNSEAQNSHYENPDSHGGSEETSTLKGIEDRVQSSPETNGAPTTDLNKAPTRKLHSRKFREYCDHCITPEILKSTTALLEDIVKFHDRQFARSPLKASAKRRHVTGLKEVRRFLALRRVRLLVIAPDLEPSTTAGGLDDIVAQLKETAKANNIPYIFALGRRQLGYILKKKVPVSCVGVLNYDGTERNFHDLMSAVEKSREDYALQVAQLSPIPPESICEKAQAEEEPVVDDINKEVVASLLAKLTTLREKDTSSPFLQAIERCSSLEVDYDDDNDDDNESKVEE